MKILLALAISASFLTGCTQSNRIISEEFPDSIETVPASLTDYEGGFKIFTQKELVRGLYEPDTGCYIGAYILSDKVSGGNISNFERITATEHSFYTYILKIGQPFPSEWMLGCIAKMKTPNIILVPENIDEPYNTKLLEETAKKCGEFSIPMFVHFYPIENANSYDAAEYKSFFKIARAYFSQHAPKAAFVWDIHINSLDLAENLYPGDESTDWVGVNIYMDIEAQTGALTTGILPKLDYFYYTFQEKKPLFISQLAISHFSSTDHAYYLKEADTAAREIYLHTANNLPRIKAVNYMSYDSITPLNMAQGNDNYSVASDSRIANIYKQIVAGDYFLSNLEATAEGEIFAQKLPLPYEAVYHGGNFYADEYCVNLLAKNQSTEMILINDIPYYCLDNAFINGDFNRKIIEVRSNLHRQ